MEKIKTGIICMLCLCMIFSRGCGKKWWDGWDGSYAWVSKDPYIYMPLEKEKVIIEINGERKNVLTGWDNSGRKIDFCVLGTDDEEEIIWEADVKLKWGKLYLTITKDRYGENEGKTIILEKQPVEEE